MSSVKLSSNYQIVIPKLVRKRLKLEKGQQLFITSVGDTSIALTTESPADRYYGVLKGVWDEDAVDYQRRLRNHELERG